MNRIVGLLLCGLCVMLSVGCGGKKSEQPQEFIYQNPLPFSYTYFDGEQEREITELRDPCIMRDGDTYYLVFTHFPFTHHTSRDESKPDLNSSPGIRLYSSKDLKNWKFENWIVKSSELPEDCPYKHRFWAPELFKHNGKYYIMFYADNWLKDEYNAAGHIGYVGFLGVADSPTGPYENITWVRGSGCDTHLFFDDDDKAYAVVPGVDVFMQAADAKNIAKADVSLYGERPKIISCNNDDIGWNFSPEHVEGPWMIKKNGKYILFTAAPYWDYNRPENDNSNIPHGYWTGVSIADNVWGPYSKQPQLFLGGHTSVFIGPDGNEWFSYRGESGGEEQGRLCIDPIRFDENGIPQPSSPSTEEVTISL
ncbi:MAG: family 43 glycosylhydrolase [Alistipes sp.]|nr:family 43 glycosylhydrolase [Alistipes sp.]